MKNKINGRIYVELVGGLGNQMFQAVATLFLAQKYSYKPIAILNRLSEGNSHNNSIFDEMSWSSLSKKRLSSIGMLVVIIGFRLATNSKTNHFRFLGFSFYSPKENGYSISEVQGKVIFLRGYFQSFKYLYGLEEKSLPKLAKPSESFIEVEQKMKFDKPIVLHIRKGDFELHTNPHGVVPTDFYKESLRYLRVKGRDVNSCWIFTDDLQGIGSYLAELPFSFLPSSLSEITATEELFLMAKADCLVIGNSTFGVWGALLAEAHSQIDTLVIRPKDPYLRMSIPKDLYPEHWIFL
jgi:hypothetical protein